jgi:2-polyprenyl-3-methyl-5-hydroxy-6-metoxy-1,4-benzoquinol methylase
MEDLKCPICNFAISPWLHVPGDWRRPKNNASYHLYWCENCKFGQVLPRPSVEEIPSFYQVEEYYTHSSNSVSQNSEVKKSFLAKVLSNLAWRLDKGKELNIQWLQNHLPNQNLSVCEIGCGNGAKLKFIKDVGYEVIGVEPDDAAREVAISEGLKVLPGTAEALPKELDDAKFDVIFLNHVLEHVREPKLALQNAKKLLSPGGKIIIETPNNISIGFKQSVIIWHFLDVPRHLSFFTSNSLKLLCKNEGLKVEELEFRGYYRQFSDGWREIEQEIFRQMQKKIEPSKLPPQNTLWQAWKLFFKTAWAAPDAKYDSVRVVVTSDR